MLFKYDPEIGAARLAAEGFVHLKGILADDFVDHLTGFVAAALAGPDAQMARWAIAGKKRQFVFDFPTPSHAEAFRDGMSRLTGIARDSFTVAERHLKVYDRAAPRLPAPHKDRAASHFSIGLPVHLPAGSSVCVFPDHQPGENRADHAVFLGGGDARAIGALYASDGARMLNERVGDVIVFWGSRLYHERVGAAGAAVLYIKANGIGLDPLGENIFAQAAEPA